MTQNRNFNDLYAFTQVVKLGNFRRAAQALGVQPSALSHRMNDLENRLNTKLLNRTTRSMRRWAICAARCRASCGLTPQAAQKAWLAEPLYSVPLSE
ncbi:MAG: LysR family transcriptional regulator [Neisseria sp.]|nr:MAG: LysR family transcriptional regulator [Neisseria sp.]